MSRVGGNAQIKAMKKVAGRLRLDLAQYRALEAFAQFGSELDKASQQQLARGARVVEILKQPQYQPQPVERQVVAIYVVTGGYLDDYPVEDAKRFVTDVQRLPRDPARRRSSTAIRETGDLSDETEAALKTAIDEFAADVRADRAAARAPSRGSARTTPPDEVKPDVGWDRMSSADDERRRRRARRRRRRA